MIDITDIKTLRATGVTLREQGLLPPFFLVVDELQSNQLKRLHSFTDTGNYGENILKHENYFSGFYFEIGAIEQFRFVVKNRRHPNRRKDDRCRYGELRGHVNR